VVVLLVVSKNLEGLMEEETDPWRTLCHGIPLNNLKQGVALTDEILYSHLKKKQKQKTTNHIHTVLILFWKD